MLIHKTHKTLKERSTIIAEMEAKGFTSISTEGYFVGEGHLLFDDGKPDPEPIIQRDYGKEIDEMRADIRKLKERGPGPEP